MSLPAGAPVVLAVACQVTEPPNPPEKPNDFVQTLSLCLKIQDLPELFLSVSIQEDVSANRRRNCWGKHAVPCRGAAQGEPEPHFPGLQGSGLRGCGGFATICRQWRPGKSWAGSSGRGIDWQKTIWTKLTCQNILSAHDCAQHPGAGSALGIVQ